MLRSTKNKCGTAIDWNDFTRIRVGDLGVGFFTAPPERRNRNLAIIIRVAPIHLINFLLLITFSLTSVGGHPWLINIIIRRRRLGPPCCESAGELVQPQQWCIWCAMERKKLSSTTNDPCYRQLDLSNNKSELLEERRRRRRRVFSPLCCCCCCCSPSCVAVVVVVVVPEQE